MNKQTKMIVGVGALAIVGYLVYKNMSKKPAASFANLTTSRAAQNMLGCPCTKGPVTSGGTSENGEPLYKCPGGQRCLKTNVPVGGGSESFAGREF